MTEPPEGWSEVTTEISISAESGIIQFVAKTFLKAEGTCAVLKDGNVSFWRERIALYKDNDQAGERVRKFLRSEYDF